MAIEFAGIKGVTGAIDTIVDRLEVRPGDPPRVQTRDGEFIVSIRPTKDFGAARAVHIEGRLWKNGGSQEIVIEDLDGDGLLNGLHDGGYLLSAGTFADVTNELYTAIQLLILSALDTHQNAG